MAMPNIKLRIKRIQGMDIGALRELSVAFMAEFNADYPIMDEQEIDKHMLQILSVMNDPNMIYLIAYAGKKPIGFGLSCIGQRDWGRPSRVLIGQQIYVVPEKCGGTVALRIMEEAARIAISMGIAGFECIGSSGGTDKRWEHLGFKPYVVYSRMPNDEFMKLVTKYTGSKE